LWNSGGTCGHDNTDITTVNNNNSKLVECSSHWVPIMLQHCKNLITNKGECEIFPKMLRDNDSIFYLLLELRLNGDFLCVYSV